MTAANGDLLTAALTGNPDLGIYAQTAHDAIDRAERDPTYKATMALLAKLPDDRARAMVTRLAIRAYAQDDQVCKRFLAQLRRDTRPGTIDDLELESAVEVALQRLALDCQAILADLGDVHRWSAHRPGTDLVPTVAVSRLGRDDEPTETIIVDRGSGDGAR